MKKVKRTSPVDESELTAFELIEKLFIIFVLAHTPTLEEAPPYLHMEVSTLHARRMTYGIPTPVRYSYKGPHLTHQEMANAFLVHLAAGAQVAAFKTPPVTPLSNVTFTPQTSPANNVPPSV